MSNESVPLRRTQANLPISHLHSNFQSNRHRHLHRPAGIPQRVVCLLGGTDCSSAFDVQIPGEHDIFNLQMLIRKELKIANDQRFFLYNVDIPLMDDSALDEAYRQLLQGVKKPLDPLSAVGDVVHGLATSRIHILVIFPSKLPSRA